MNEYFSFVAICSGMVLKMITGFTITIARYRRAGIQLNRGI